MAVNPRYTTPRAESYTVNIQYMMCSIFDSMRHVVVFCREMIVLQVSIIYDNFFLILQVVLFSFELILKYDLYIHRRTL